MAYKFVEVLEEAGLPAGVLNYIPGSGAEVGDYLVDHPRTRFISFTGSRDVGIRIYERAAKVHPGQIWLKRVIAEMGGKDGIIVDKERTSNWRRNRSWRRRLATLGKNARRARAPLSSKMCMTKC
ncbi:1-pyrroline-5-carboxylate dehydrogenase [[Flavobacterium] thermophilum]|nr:1-pyrroline-5-carboxylate dehydrogenase [[Flavobacterium] thermophilum]